MIDAYAAGLVDGEGCIWISRDDFTPSLAVGMAGRSLTLLEELAARYGGRVRVMREATEKWSTAYDWTLIGSKCVEALRRMEPHMRLKAEQAQLVFRLQALRDQRIPTKTGTQQPRFWTPELRERAETIRMRVEELNRRGPDGDNGWPEGAYARLVAGTFVTRQLDMFSDLGYATFSGPWPTSGWMSDGACWTADTPEYPKEGAVFSSLQDVLETGPIPEKYFLSPRAAAGILRRAQKRGRELPEALRTALESLARSPATPEEDAGTTRPRTSS